MSLAKGVCAELFSKLSFFNWLEVKFTSFSYKSFEQTVQTENLWGDIFEVWCHIMSWKIYSNFIELTSPIIFMFSNICCKLLGKDMFAKADVPISLDAETIFFVILVISDFCISIFLFNSSICLWISRVEDGRVDEPEK